jgi:hypothetical protein
MNRSPAADSAPSADTSGLRADARLKDQKWHDARGRFVKGNPGGPGNPFARRTARMLKAIRSVFTPERFKEVATMVYLKAIGGDLAAAKIILPFAGKTPDVDPDRLEIDEWKLRLEQATDARDMKAVMTRLPVECANEIIRAAIGPLGAGMMKKLHYVLQIADPKQARRWIKKQMHKAARTERETQRAQQRAERAQRQAAENNEDLPAATAGRAGLRQRPDPLADGCGSSPAAPSPVGENGERTERPEPDRPAVPPSPVGEIGQPECPPPDPVDHSGKGGPSPIGKNGRPPDAIGAEPGATA